MEKTGNTITVHIFAGFNYEMQPVMRNGKPTKRMKEVRIDTYADMNATGYMLEGHEVFVLDKDMEDETKSWARTFKSNGERLTCMCKFGRTGTADHEVSDLFDKKLQKLVCYSMVTMEQPFMVQVQQ